MPRNNLIQVRRDTAANWTSVNPTLASGEIGLETDTGKLKIGTGSTAWTSLLYVADASYITGTALASNVVTSSLTTIGTLGSLNVSGNAVISGNVTVDTNTLKVDSTNNRVGVNTTSPGTALDVVGTITARAGATQDGVALAGRAGGTSSYEVTLQPTTLTADRTITLPDSSGTLAYISSIETDAIGYESGAYYTARVSGLSNSIAFTTNTAYYIPFFVTKTTTFDRIAVRGGASMTGTSTVRLGIYTNSNGKPTTVLNDYGTVSVSVNTTGEITISKSLERGWYWLVAVAQTSTGNNAFQACNPVLQAHNTRVASSFTPVMYAGWSQTGVTGALATAGTLSESNQPVAVMLRAA